MSVAIGEAIQTALRCLRAHGITEARPAAEVLLADLLACPRSFLYLEARRLLTAAQYAQYVTRIRRRSQGEPVQYITGRQEFWSLEFVVTPEVLIPRPESELLVEQGLRVLAQWQAGRPLGAPWVLDVGTGSGCLAISLAHGFPQSRVVGIDLAPGALRVAQRNARRLGVADRVHWVCGDLLTPWRAGGPPFALCVANLPYVSTVEWQRLPRELREHEPRHALDGGHDGLELIRRLVATSPVVLASGGMLLLEVGWQQAATVQALVRQQGHGQAVGVLQDLAGIERVVWVKMP